MRAFVALIMAVALAAPARAVVLFDAGGGYFFSGGGGSFGDLSQGAEPQSVGGDYTFSRNGALCPSPDTADFLCAHYYSSADLVGSRVILRSEASLERKQAIGLGYGGSDHLVYADTRIHIINVGTTVGIANGILHFVFGLHGTASTTKTSDQVISQATGVATLSADKQYAIQCIGDPCAPYRVKVENVTFATSNDTTPNSFYLTLRADARAGAPIGFPYDAQVSADFGDTLEILAIEVHDADDNFLPDARAFVLGIDSQPIFHFANTLPPTTTTTTTIVDGSTTTTTLPGPGSECAQGASYPGLACRVAALQTLLGQLDVGKLARPLGKTLGKAATALTLAEQTTAGPAKRHAKALKKATRAMAAFAKKLASKGAVKKLDQTTRDALGLPAAGITTDLAGLI